MREGVVRLAYGAGRVLRAARREFAAPLAALLGVVILQQAAALAPAFVERVYGRALYPRVARTLSVVTGALPFSVGEVFVILLSALLAAALARLALLLVRKRGGARVILFAHARAALWCAAVLGLAFMLAFGFNYQRPPLVETLGYEQRRATVDELEAMTAAVVEAVNRNYEESHAEGYEAPDARGVARILEEAYAREPELSRFRVEGFGPPKPVHFSGLLTRLGISGIYFPFTGEPNYNAEPPDFQQPFSMAHEMAHQRGFARESEANFVAFLVCVRAGDPSVRYSGYRFALGVGTELYRLDPAKARTLFNRLGLGYREDSRAAAKFWLRAEGRAGALSARLNDLYLRANRISSGTRNYGEATALLIGYYLKSPPRRPPPDGEGAATTP